MLHAEYIYMMQKFCSVNNFKPQNSEVRGPDSRIFMARSSQGSKFLWDRNYRLQNAIICIRNSETCIIVGCKTSAAWLILGPRIPVTLQATLITLCTVKYYRLQNFCNMVGHTSAAWVIPGCRISAMSDVS